MVFSGLRGTEDIRASAAGASGRGTVGSVKVSKAAHQPAPLSASPRMRSARLDFMSYKCLT
ncbi:MAG: hypothetical protein Q9173_005675 [Seirophora scorigena]